MTWVLSLRKISPYFSARRKILVLQRYYSCRRPLTSFGPGDGFSRKRFDVDFFLSVTRGLYFIA